MWELGSTDSLVVGVQTYIATMEINVAVPQEAGKRSTWRSSYTIFGIYTKDSTSTTEIFAHVNCFSFIYLYVYFSAVTPFFGKILYLKNGKPSRAFLDLGISVDTRIF